MMSRKPGLRFVTRIALSFITLLLILTGTEHLKAQAFTVSTEEIIKVYLDEDELVFNIPPRIKNGTTLVPFRALFEALGMEVDWEPQQRLVTGKNDAIHISLIIGEKKATVNGEVVPLLAASEIVDGNTLIPLRFVSEATGASVFWDPYYREITIITLEFMEKLNFTKEELEMFVEELLANRDIEQESVADASDPDPAPQTELKPIAPVDLNHLTGMYYGSRYDYAGYECGGVCWDFYTFLPNNLVFIGLPEAGGPETINCTEHDCLSYSIQNGELRINNDESLSIEISDNGFLMINDVKLDAVQTTPDDIVIEHDYVHMGYTGLIGITGAASSWTNYLSLYADGTYELSGFSLSSIGANSDISTHASSNDDIDQGRFVIEGNTITFTSSDGTIIKSLFFLHNTNPEGVHQHIQIGSKNFYIKD